MSGEIQKAYEKQHEDRILGGTGLIGIKVVNLLRQRPRSGCGISFEGINSLTGEGLAEALTGAQVGRGRDELSFVRRQACMEFFETSRRNLLAAEEKTGVGHHVAISVVGTDRLPASGYFRAKVAQEKLIKASRFLTRSARDAVLRVR